MTGDVGMLLRFATGLRRFLTEPAGPAEARQVLEESLRQREQSFLQLAKRAVFEWPASPYYALMRRAGIEFGDLEKLVRTNGMEAALDRLLDAGVYLTLDEFKGRTHLKRPGLELELSSASCDNPCLQQHFEAATGGSGGVRRRLSIDLELLRYETALHVAFLDAAGILNAPMAVWRPVPPGSAGIKRSLEQVRGGLTLERWFTQEPFSVWRPATKSWAVTMTALAVSRLAGKRLPIPETTELGDAEKVAAWAAGVLRSGRTPHIDTNVTSGVRVLRAARENGLNLSGAFFRLGSEPYTEGRARLFAEAGCRAVAHYSIAETGPVGVACANAQQPDESHFIHGKLAHIARTGVPGVRAPDGVEPLFLTTLLTATPKVMINVESGDTAVRTRRGCGCLLERIGFHTHLHTIRSYEKLTSGGMHFAPAVLMSVIEDVLPARFGGDATDYQFAEEDEGGLSRVTVRAHPRLGALDERAVCEAVLQGLGHGSQADRMMAEAWRQGGVLRVQRRAPEVTAAGKVLALDQTRTRV